MKRRVWVGGGIWILVFLAVFSLGGCGLLNDPAPTVTPIYITATPEAPVLPIVATETPQATNVVFATSAALLPTAVQITRTATPSPLPPITMTPSFTPTHTDTPVTPGAVGFYGAVGGNVGSTTCASSPQGIFGAIYQGDADIAAALGCAVGGASSATSAYQNFQNGLMLWVSSLGAQQPQGVIYALASSGSYQRFNDTWVEGVDPDSGGAEPPSAGLSEPVRGFGKIWRENSSVRDALGWATSGENGGSATVQVFERGEMIAVPQTGQTYIMLSGAPGSWIARSGS